MSSEISSSWGERSFPQLSVSVMLARVILSLERSYAFKSCVMFYLFILSLSLFARFMSMLENLLFLVP